MKRTLLTACLFSLPLMGAACTDADAPLSDDPEANLPGDIDNSTDVADGKGDAFGNTSSDPARISRNLQYTLTSLPRTGKLDRPIWKDRYPAAPATMPVAWADTYWPSIHGSTNARWLGRTVKSPLEKYDAAFNNAPGCATMPSATCGEGISAQWDTYFTCAGPAATWQMKNFQSLNEQIDGRDNDGDGKKDECDGTDDEGTQGWWGLCHAWTPAALLEPEPQKAVMYNGVRFEVADIKALIVTLYDDNDAVMLGGRCNSKTFTPSATTPGDHACFDANAGAMHVVLANMIGINDAALAMDKTPTFEVWNQPIVEYTVDRQDEVTAQRAMACVGATGSTYTYNRSATKLFEVTTRVKYLFEGDASTRPLGMTGFLAEEDYHYILEVGTAGKVIGGRYCTGSEGPDFLWAPLNVAASSSTRNQHVKLAEVRTLLGLAIAAGDTPTTPGKTYENATGAAIPDNATAGASVTIDVPDTFAFANVAVTVDIEHTWRGDLKVELQKDGVTVATLHNKEGGSADNLTVTTTLTPAQLGGSTAGKARWTLKVVDSAAQDTGRIKLFKLAFAS